MPLPTDFPRPLRDTSLRAAVCAIPALMLAAMLAALPAAAQTQTQPPAGQPAPAQPGQGQPQGEMPVEATFGDWAERCTPEPPPAASPPEAGQQEACFLMQQYLDPQSQRPVLKVTIGLFGPQRQPGAVIAFPLGVPLARGVQISVDGQPVASVPFQVCRRDGCQAFMEMDEPVVTAFKAGQQAVATVQASQGESLDLPFSLSGFTAGFDDIQ